MTKDEALKMAIEALENLREVFMPSNYWNGVEIYDDTIKAIQACKEVLATNKESSLVQLEQEPVAYIKQGMDGYPKLVFNGTFTYESTAARWDDIALYIKEQI